MCAVRRTYADEKQLSDDVLKSYASPDPECQVGTAGETTSMAKLTVNADTCTLRKRTKNIASTHRAATASMGGRKREVYLR